MIFMINSFYNSGSPRPSGSRRQGKEMARDDRIEKHLQQQKNFPILTRNEECGIKGVGRDEG